MNGKVIAGIAFLLGGAAVLCAAVVNAAPGWYIKQPVPPTLPPNGNGVCPTGYHRSNGICVKDVTGGNNDVMTEAACTLKYKEEAEAAYNSGDPVAIATVVGKIAACWNH